MIDTNNYSSDAPIVDFNEDKFNRYPFAKRIAGVISGRKDPSSIVIGINGAWGEGKTSVFNFIQNELEREEDIVCLKFNPWRFGAEELMLENFFNELARIIDKSLSTKAEKISNVISKFTTPLARAAGYGDIADEVNNSFFSGADLDELRSRIEKLLEEEQKRVVVLIDDIDRLDKNEIHSLFRLIKLTADFKYTAYVLAFDKEVVTSALQEKYSYSSSLTGASFLEKIIQVPLQLPSADIEDLREYCFNDLDLILANNKINLTQSEASNFHYYFTTSLELFLHTPRQAKLYANILTFSLPLLKDEVNEVDLMLIEGIRVFTPSIYTFIKDNRELFLNGANNNGFSRTDTDKEEKAKRINTALSYLGDEESKGMLRLLKYLFPKLESVFTNIQHGELDHWSLNQRICAKGYFHRYFSYSVNKKDVSDIIMDDLLIIADKTDEIKTREKLSEIMTDQNRESIMIKLRRKTKGFTTKQAKNISLALASISNDLPLMDGFLKFTKFGDSALVIGDCISSIKDDELRLTICKNVLEKIENLDFALETFRFLKSENEDETNYNEENLLSKNDYKDIGRYLADIIANRLYGGISKEPREYLSYMFLIWNEYGIENEATDYLTKKIQKDVSFVFEFLESYTPMSYNSKGRHRGDFKRDSYEAVCELIDPQIIIDHLHDKYIFLPNDHGYPSSFDIERNELLARQFIWLNNNK